MPAVRAYTVTIIAKRTVLSATDPAHAVEQVGGEANALPSAWRVVELSSKEDGA